MRITRSVHLVGMYAMACIGVTRCRIRVQVICTSDLHGNDDYAMLSYWKHSIGNFGFRNLMILLGAYRVVKIHN